MRFYSPLRYPGGKTRLASFIGSMIKENNLLGVDYVEPYAGGAGVALSMLFEEYASSITINDIDRSIYAFWHSVVHSNDRLCESIENIEVNIPNWIRARQTQSNKRNKNLFDLGFSTFFLNRTNVSGIIKGGVIGGIKQKGAYKIDARFNKKELIERIQKIDRFRDRINVSNKDGLELLKKINKRSFIYLDPPYVNKAKGLYINSYTEKDHLALAQFLQQKIIRKNYWITSYDETSFILNSYNHCRKRLFWSNSYGASNITNAREVIFVANNLHTKKSLKYLRFYLGQDIT